MVGVGYQGCSQGTWPVYDSAILRGTVRYYSSRNKSLARDEYPMGKIPSSLSKWSELVVVGIAEDPLDRTSGT